MYRWKDRNLCNYLSIVCVVVTWYIYNVAIHLNLSLLKYTLMRNRYICIMFIDAKHLSSLFEYALTKD